MNPLKIVYGDVAYLQTLTTSTADAQYPGTNAMHPHLSRAWRTTSAAAQWIKFDAGAGKTIAFDTAVIVGHNFTSAATVSAQTATGDAWAPPDTASKNGDPSQSIIIVDLKGSTAVRWARIYIDDAANPAGYLMVGRVMLCTRAELETIDRGFSVGVDDSTVISRSLTGQLFADVGVQQKSYMMSMGTMADATKRALLTLVQTVGQYTPVVVIPCEANLPGGVGGIDPLYATMSKAVRFTDAGGWGWKDDVLQFTEAK
jgi:hypothetical protein